MRLWHRPSLFWAPAGMAGRASLRHQPGCAVITGGQSSKCLYDCSMRATRASCGVSRASSLAAHVEHAVRALKQIGGQLDWEAIKNSTDWMQTAMNEGVHRGPVMLPDLSQGNHQAAQQSFGLRPQEHAGRVRCPSGEQRAHRMGVFEAQCCGASRRLGTPTPRERKRMSFSASMLGCYWLTCAAHGWPHGLAASAQYSLSCFEYFGSTGGSSCSRRDGA